MLRLQETGMCCASARVQVCRHYNGCHPSAVPAAAVLAGQLLCEPTALRVILATALRSSHHSALLHRLLVPRQLILCCAACPPSSVLQANRFARDTGHSVALFTVGGIFSDMEDATDFAGEAYVLDVKDKNNSPVQQGLKVAVLKYGTGGVSKQLTTRGEIVKFVSARGSKAMQELHAMSREEQHQASA